MRLRHRYRRLSLWNKFSVWTGVATFVGVTLAILFQFCNSLQSRQLEIKLDSVQRPDTVLHAAAVVRLNLYGAVVENVEHHGYSGVRVSFSALRAPWLVAATPLKDIKDLVELSLSELYLYGTKYPEVTDLTPLAPLKSLRYLNLTGTRVSDLSPLSKLPEIRFLVLDYTPVSDLRPIATLDKLRSLDLIGTRVSDLRPITGLHNLRSMALAESPLTDLSPLYALENLRVLDLRGTPHLDAVHVPPNLIAENHNEIEALKARMPQLQVIGAKLGSHLQPSSQRSSAQDEQK